MGVEHKTAANVEACRQIEVITAFRTGGAKQVSHRIRHLAGHRAVGQGAINFPSVGAVEIGRIAARVVVIKCTDIKPQTFGNFTLVPGIEIHFNIARHIPCARATAFSHVKGRSIAEPANARVPVADIKAAGMSQVETALNGGFLVGLRNAAITIIADDTDVAS